MLLLNIADRDREAHDLGTGKYKLTRSEQDTGSSVDEDSLLHLETLLVVTAGNSEDVALELFSHDIAFDLLTHSSVVEGTAKKRVLGFAEDTRQSLWRGCGSE